MKKCSFNLLLMPVLALLAACSAPYRAITIETVKPSVSMLPASIHSLTLVNRALTPEFQNFAEDSLQQYFYDQGFNAQSVALDSVAADTTLRALGELLYESGRYDVVIPQARNMKRDLKFYLVPESLDWDEVESICTDFETDALLAIERYYNKIMTHYATIGDEWGTASIDSKYDVVVKVYDPKKREIVRQIVATDTISWRDGDQSTKRLFSRMPSIKQCLIQTGIQAALDLDQRLSPSWVKDGRIFFLVADGDESRINNWVNALEWQTAYDYWANFARNPKSTIRCKAEFNLALASEMLGNIDQAIEWAAKSYQTRYMNQTDNYLKKLKQRKEILDKFNQ